MEFLVILWLNMAWLVSHTRKHTRIQATNAGRIESIDVLRAIVLLGILIVHCFGGFGIDRSSIPVQHIDSILNWVVLFGLNGKCHIAFATLFGVSFYLMLRKPTASTQRFVWRCFLLICIGFINKRFYWYDVLMLYGVVGMSLTLFRYVPTRKLVVYAAICFLLSVFVVPQLGLPQKLFPGRDFSFVSPQTTYLQIISRPVLEGIEAYLYYILHSGGLGTLSFALMGYAIGKEGLLAKLPNIITAHHLWVMWLLTIVSLYIRLHLEGVQSWWWYQSFDCLLACYTYSVTVLYIYYHTTGKCVCKWLAAYGRLGLTNYSMQAVISVYCFSASGLCLAQAGSIHILVFIASLYTVQLLFSYVWLRYKKYGPLEWLWRCATERRLISNKR